MFAKTTEFEDDLQHIARLAKVFSHPARLAILRLLAESKTCISGDIAEKLPLSRTTVSQHLQELKKTGLIQGETDGLNICYCIDFEEYKKQKRRMEHFLNQIQEGESAIQICASV